MFSHKFMVHSQVSLHHGVEQFQPFNCQPHKMVKHTQTIRRPIADELLECDHFVGLALKELKTIPNGNTNRTPTLNNKITTK